MLLAIDSGNTNAVFAVYDGDTLRASWRISTNPRRTADEYAIWLTQLLSLAGLKPSELDAAMYGQAESSSRHVSAATGANTIAPVTSATAVALCVSSLPDSSRFQTACTNAAASAKSKADVGIRA